MLVNLCLIIQRMVNWLSSAYLKDIIDYSLVHFCLDSKCCIILVQAQAFSRMAIHLITRNLFHSPPSYSCTPICISSTFSGEDMNSLSGTSTHCSLAFVCNFSLGSRLYSFGITIGITSETFTWNSPSIRWVFQLYHEHNLIQNILGEHSGVEFLIYFQPAGI